MLELIIFLVVCAGVGFAIVKFAHNKDKKIDAAVEEIEAQKAKKAAAEDAVKKAEEALKKAKKDAGAL